MHCCCLGLVVAFRRSCSWNNCSCLHHCLEAYVTVSSYTDFNLAAGCRNCRRLYVLPLSHHRHLLFRQCEVCFIFWHPNLWIKIGQTDARCFCAIGGSPCLNFRKIRRNFPISSPIFHTGAKSPKFWLKFRHHSYLYLRHFELEDFLGKLKKLPRTDGGRTAWYQPGGGGSFQLWDPFLAKCTQNAPKG